MQQLSVIVCTHNPRLDVLQRVLCALRGQSLTLSDWELIIVDNGSAPPVRDHVDLGWHPHARVIGEPRLGLTWARLRGANEAKAELVVYVDDDNVLAPDYLNQVLTISGRFPFLGAWGGRVIPEFAVPPAPDVKDYLDLLALCDVPRDVWCNYRTPRCLPRGAGMAVRKPVIRAYARRVSADSVRQQLERTGASLASCGDSDLCFTALDEGYGLGMFTCLQVTHIIPETRTRLDYLLRLQEAMAFSWTVLNFLYDGPATLRSRKFAGRIADAMRAFLKSSVDRAFLDASRRGRQRAMTALQSSRAQTDATGR